MAYLKNQNLEQLANHGNGHYAYIDTLDRPARCSWSKRGGSCAWRRM
ncbi:MAG: hypothetical protein U0792_11485 [Gemmataceae bacterium]